MDKTYTKTLHGSLSVTKYMSIQSDNKTKKQSDRLKRICPKKLFWKCSVILYQFSLTAHFVVSDYLHEAHTK